MASNSAHAGSGPGPGHAVRDVLAALVVLALSGITSFAGSEFIARAFPDRPMPTDLLFEVLPYVRAVRYVPLITVYGSITVLFLHVIRTQRVRLPEIVAVFGLMYLLRSAMMVLTPLADAQGPQPFLFALQNHGMFPSGHVAASVLSVRLLGEGGPSWLRPLQTAFLVVGAAALVLAHGHYSIDIAGGLLLGYFVEREWSYGRLFGPVRRMVGCGRPYVS